MKDINHTKPYLELLTSEGTRKNDIIMFSFIFAIILYIVIFVPNSPVSGNEKELYTNEQLQDIPSKTNELTKNSSTTSKPVITTAGAMQ